MPSLIVPPNPSTFAFAPSSNNRKISGVVKLLLLCLISLAFLSPSLVVAEFADVPALESASEFSKDDGYIEDGPAPALLLMMLIMLAVFLIVLAAGVALGLFLIACVLAMLAMGILATSTLVALTSRKPKSGVDAFVIQSVMLTGAASGIGVALLVAWLAPTVEPSFTNLAIGGCSGLSAGFLLALLINVIWDKALSLLIRFGRSRLASG